MKRQRGMALGWIYLIALVVLVGALTGLVMAWKSYTNGIDQKGYDRGKQETEAAYAKRDNEALRLKAARIKELEKSARAMEAKHAKQLASIAQKRENERRKYEDQKRRDAAAIAAGELRLFDPGAVACQSGVGSGGEGSAATASPGERDGGAAGELSQSATTFLFDLANEADDVAQQLAQAQAVILEDRAICGE